MPSQEPKADSIKYGLLKFIDITGFKVFDPVVRLCFGEEPQKQLGQIGRFMIVPVIFVFCCMMLWAYVAPRHKTKSGEVPDPTQVWGALVVNDTLHKRENEKEADFLLTGEARTKKIAEVETLLKAKEAEAKTLKETIPEIAASVQSDIDASLAPVQKKYDELKATHKQEVDARKEKIKALAQSVANNEASNEQLIALLREDSVAKKEARETQKAIKEQIAAINDNPPKVLKNTQLQYSSIENEVQHLKKRLDYLNSGNRGQKVEKAEQAVVSAQEKLDAAEEPAAILAAAKSVVKGKEKVERITSQKYPRRATIWFQVWRSLFTVFIGFVLAAAIAIPVGIMCGLNKVVMACLTPLISVFKPVSPVVWLLIFQIVVGAFFPNPETHPLFVFASSLPWIGGLKVNPAMVYSACTVAMCAVWPALVNTALGVSSIDQDHLNVAKVLKLGLWARLTKIIIPSSLPLIFAGLRISLGVGWMVLIAAEALSSSDGLGKYVWDEYQNGSSQTFANIIFACFVVGIIGFFLDRIMIILQRSVSFGDGAATV